MLRFAEENTPSLPYQPTTKITQSSLRLQTVRPVTRCGRDNSSWEDVKRSQWDLNYKKFPTFTIYCYCLHFLELLVD